MTSPLRQELIRLANENPEMRKHLYPLLRTATTTNKVKAKPGDLIQSLHFRRPQDGSLLGTVVKVEVEEKDGVEYVYFTPIVDIGSNGIATAHKHGLIRAPQNGTPTLMGKITSGIYVIA